ncbi:50S ribosomal protein L6 [Patescibacteria group bacterium]|nr:50S ribosomal protein L6 [Patescibacteria group bacterium]
MSRIGKKTILIPANVEIKISGNEISVKGPKGELFLSLPDELAVSIKEVGAEAEKIRELTTAVKNKTKRSPALWGLFRSLIFNMVYGVTSGFEKKLEINGVGYRAIIEGKKLVLNLGLSHPIEIEAPEGIEFKVEKNLITISGADKQLVGQIAAKIRAQKKPEPYKGKGIKYLDEVIRRKSGKKAASAE